MCEVIRRKIGRDIGIFYGTDTEILQFP
ncbi:MAG: hypothetical protein E7523_01530 [Ruminococcaceae bacterium]|nr:hypothetical protein [Oscillospiraceae bacterium]